MTHTSELLCQMAATIFAGYIAAGFQRELAPDVIAGMAIRDAQILMQRVEEQR